MTRGLHIISLGLNRTEQSWADAAAESMHRAWKYRFKLSSLMSHTSTRQFMHSDLCLVLDFVWSSGSHLNSHLEMMAVPALVHYSIPFASIKCIWWLGFVHTNLPNYYWFSVAYLSKAFMIFAPSDLLLLHPFRSPIMLKYIRFFARMNSLFTRSKIATANTIAPLNELHLQNTKCFFSSSAFICIAYFVIAVVVLFYCHCRTYLVGKVAVVVWLTHLNFFNCL